MKPESSRDPLLGLNVHGYVLREKLAEGGMGAVYVAAHERLTHSKKVVKVLLGEYAHHEMIRARFEREANAASRLRHPHVIKIDNFGQLPDGQLFLMMPLLEGRTLEQHLQQQAHMPQTLHHTLQVVAQILGGLNHIHAAGIVHRDLKPGNVFLTTEPGNPYFVTLLDLGIARDVAEEASTFKTITGLSIGTPGYMPPEQYGSAAEASPAADVYAVGVILWEMLAGHRPWSAPSEAQLYHQQITQRPELPTKVRLAPEVLELLHQTLAPDPAKRPKVRELANRLASLIAAEPPYNPRSGADILVAFAPDLVTSATPDETTLRAKGERGAAPVVWPPPNTNIPELVRSAPPDLFSSPRIDRAASQPTTPLRPSPDVALAETPLLAAPQGTSPSRTIALAVGGALIVGFATFGLVSVVRNKRRPAAISEHAPQAVLVDAGIAMDARIAGPAPAVAPLIETAPAPSHMDAGLPAPRHRTHVETKARGSAATDSSHPFNPDAVEE